MVASNMLRSNGFSIKPLAPANWQRRRWSSADIISTGVVATSGSGRDRNCCNNATPSRLRKRTSMMTRSGRCCSTEARGLASSSGLNPQEIRLRLDLASMLADAGRGAECAEQLDAAERIEAALVNREVSVQRFSPDELAEIEMLRRRAALLVAGGDADGD